jgi:hypothetical protein
MNKAKRLLSVTLSAALLGGTTARAAFQVPIASPESAAMAGTGLGGSRDSASLFVNPARLAGMIRADFYFMYDQMYAGMPGVGTIGQGFVSGGVPTKHGVFAFGVGMFRAAGLLEERTLALTYGRKLGERVEVGVTAKQLSHSYLIGNDPLAANDPVFRNGRSAAAFALDFGLTAQATDELTLGLAVRNLNRPDVGLAVSDRVPREIQASAGYALRDKRLRFTTDVTYRDNDAGRLRDHLTPAVGVEKSLEGERFLFRAGLTPQSLSAGFGLRLGNLGLDYALVLNRNLNQGSVGTHQLGLRLRFGGPAEASRVVAALPASVPEVAAALPAAVPEAAAALPAAVPEVAAAPPAPEGTEPVRGGSLEDGMK